LKGIAGLPALSILGAPSAWNYRNKMEFSFGDVYPPAAGQWLKLGMKPKGRWYEILDLQECHLPSPEAAPLLAAVRTWAEKEKVPPYNSHKKNGQLRHLVIREAKNRADHLCYETEKALKEAKTRLISRHVSDEKKELAVLDSDFEGVMQE